MGIALPPNIRAVSLDFANTLYPLRPSELETTIERLHEFLERELRRAVPYAAMRELYLDIRARQFTENRPTLRENDFTARIRHVVAGVIGERPDDAFVSAAEDAYAQGFIGTMRAPDGLAETVREISRRFDGRVAVCSNFIRRDCIVEPLRRDGLLPHLKAVVVSCEIGFIKPHAAVFEALQAQIGEPADAIVHIGDDWDADIIGASRAGMSAIYTTEWRDEPDPCYGTEYHPLAEIGQLRELVAD